MKTHRQVITSLLVTSVVLLALFMVLAVVAYLKGRKIEHDSLAISTDAVPGSIDAHALRGTISRSIGYAILAGMADPDSTVRARGLTVSGDADQAFHEILARYRSTIHIDPEKDRLLVAQLEKNWVGYERLRSRYVELVYAGDRSASNAFFVHQVLPAYEIVIDSAEELLRYNHANIDSIARSIVGNNSSLRWTMVIILTLASLCVAILVGDIVARRQQYRAIRESEQRLRLVLDNVFAYVVVLEPNGTAIEVNQSTLDAFGLKREQVVGAPFSDISWMPRSAESLARIQRTLVQAAAGQTVRYDAEVPRDDGRVITLDFSCGPLRDAKGRVVLLVATAVDISARKDMEQQFLRAQRMEAIGMLSGGLAHDLNNILAPMLMAAGLLKLRLTASADQKMVALIETGAQRGAGIIRQLLTFSRGADGKKGAVQLRQLMHEMVHIMKETFPRNIEVSDASPLDLWPVIADTTQLHQVLLNLCVNARDAMPQGGRLALLAENLTVNSDNSGRYPQASPGRYVLLTVTDTGEGIPRDIINRIFDPFFTTKPVGKGTGLGLSTVLGIVKSHSGVLTVDSEPGKGTTFKLYLPATELVEKVVEIPTGKRGAGETILLVDDEVAMRDTARELLEQHNYRVIVAGNGQEAVEQFVEHRDTIRLVLTDLDMPVMSGAELIRTLKVLEPELRFLVMTGSSLRENRPELPDVGMSEVLTKPCEPALLLKAIAEKLQA